MDRLLAMQAFVWVVELGGFTKAATAMGVPKTTLSSQVQALESHLQLKLLNRTTRHVSVTPDGALYFERAARLLQELDELEARSISAATAVRGKLRVDVPLAFGRRILIPALPDFFRRYPEIQLEIGCTDRPFDLLQEGVDCAIRGGEILDDALVARKLGDIRMVTCAAPRYLGIHGRPDTPEELALHVLIHQFSAKSGQIFEFGFEKDGTKKVLRGRYMVSTNDAEACISAALAGLGISQIPTFMAQTHLANGELEGVLGAYLSENIPVHAVYLPNRRQSIRVRVFVEWVAQLFANSDLIQQRTSLVGLD